MEKIQKLLNDQEIEEIVKLNEELKEVYSLNDKIDFLESLEIDQNIMRNIILSNPFFLTRDISDLKDLIARLKEIGIEEFDTMLDTYPYLLNKTRSDIDDYIKVNRDKTDIDIKETLESRPYEIDEIEEL